MKYIKDKMNASVLFNIKYMNKEMKLIILNIANQMTYQVNIV